MSSSDHSNSGRSSLPSTDERVSPPSTADAASTTLAPPAAAPAVSAASASGSGGGREIYRNGWLRCIPYLQIGDDQLPKSHLENLFVSFCIHDHDGPWLEFYDNRHRSNDHKPVARFCLNECIHVSPRLVSQEEDCFEFAVTLRDKVLRLATESQELTREWVSTLTDKLRERGVLRPKENDYTVDPHQQQTSSAVTAGVSERVAASSPSIVVVPRSRRDMPLPPTPLDDVTQTNTLRAQASGNRGRTERRSRRLQRLLSPEQQQQQQQPARSASLSDEGIQTNLMEMVENSALFLRQQSLESTASSASSGSVSNSDDGPYAVPVLSQGGAVGGATLPVRDPNSPLPAPPARVQVSLSQSSLHPQSEQPIYEPIFPSAIGATKTASAISRSNLTRTESERTAFRCPQSLNVLQTSSNNKRHSFVSLGTDGCSDSDIIRLNGPASLQLPCFTRQNTDFPRVAPPERNLRVNPLLSSHAPASLAAAERVTARDTAYASKEHCTAVTNSVELGKSEQSLPGGAFVSISLDSSNNQTELPKTARLPLSDLHVSSPSSQANATRHSQTSTSSFVLMDHAPLLANIRSTDCAGPSHKISTLNAPQLPARSRHSIAEPRPLSPKPLKALLRREATQDSMLVTVKSCLPVDFKTSPCATYPAIADCSTSSLLSEKTQSSCETNSNKNNNQIACTLNGENVNHLQTTFTNSSGQVSLRNSTVVPRPSVADMDANAATHVDAPQISARESPYIEISATSSTPQSISRSTATHYQTPQIPLREAQIQKLQEEMAHQAGVLVKLSKRDLSGSLALVDVGGAVYIAGWNKPSIRTHLHVGDRLLDIGGRRVVSASDANKTIKTLAGAASNVNLNLELTVQRMPYGKALAIRRTFDGENLGLIMLAGTNEIHRVLENGLANRSGLTLMVPSVLDSGITLTSWWVTEVNHRPINLFYKNSEIEPRLQAVGKDISIVVQPSDFIKCLKKQLKSMWTYRSYIVQ